MGLFSFLKSDKPSYSDKIWRNHDMALRGMITDAMLAITRKEIPVVICFFEEELKTVIQFLSAKGVPFLHVSERLTEVPDAVCVVSVTHIPEFISAIQAKTEFLFYGHYPLPSKEEALLKKLEAHRPTAPIRFYSSLDEPSLKIFGGEKIGELLDKLGMKEDEAIEHDFVSRAMKRAREKVELKVRTEVAAPSEPEWFARNMKI